MLWPTLYGIQYRESKILACELYKLTVRVQRFRPVQRALLLLSATVFINGIVETVNLPLRMAIKVIVRLSSALKGVGGSDVQIGITVEISKQSQVQVFNTCIQVRTVLVRVE